MARYVDWDREKIDDPQLEPTPEQDQVEDHLS